MNVVNTNISALRATNASVMAGKMLGTSMERLSSGKRINSAADDAAGLAIAASMTSQIRGMAQGVRNANDGISLAQTAEGALDEVTNMLQRMRELTVQRSNETYSATDIANIDSERNALASQINSVVTNTTFNGINLFSTATNTITVQAGAEAVDAINLTLPELDVAAGSLAAQTQQLTLPDNHYLSENPTQLGNTGSGIWWRAAGPSRFQIVYDGSHLTGNSGVTGPITLTKS